MLALISTLLGVGVKALVILIALAGVGVIELSDFID